MADSKDVDCHNSITVSELSLAMNALQHVLCLAINALQDAFLLVRSWADLRKSSAVPAEVGPLLINKLNVHSVGRDADILHHDLAQTSAACTLTSATCQPLW